MAINVAKILSRVALLESKRAVFNGLADILKANYLPNDGGDAESVFYRQDLGAVPPAHVEEAIQTLFELVDEIEKDIENWSALEVDDTKEVPKEKKRKHGAHKEDGPADGSG
jgi:hypothetical protein